MDSTNSIHFIIRINRHCRSDINTSKIFISTNVTWHYTTVSYLSYIVFFLILSNDLYNVFVVYITKTHLKCYVLHYCVVQDKSKSKWLLKPIMFWPDSFSVQRKVRESEFCAGKARNRKDSFLNQFYPRRLFITII